MMRLRLARFALVLPLCLSVGVSCDHDDDEPLQLDDFRSEIGEAGLSRVVIGRMYQRGKWIVGAVDTKAPASAKIAHVCAAITPLTPTYVSGLVRLDDDDVVTAEMLEVFEGVKECVRKDPKVKKTGRKVRFDVVLNAKHYTEDTEGGVHTKKQGLDRLKERVKSANKLDPDGYFFDFFSDPWTSKEGVFHPDALEDGIAWIQGQGRFVGGNTGGFAPPGTDFIAVNDRGGFENLKETVDRLVDHWPNKPVLLHVRNDPHCVGSEGRRYVERDRKYRKQRLRRHLRWSDRLDLTYMFPVLFPLYPTNPHVDACDHGKPDNPDPAHIGEVFDPQLDGNLLDRMVEYIGPAPKKGEPLQKASISDEDALPSQYDLDDEGLVAVHLALAGGAAHHYSTSLYELEEALGLAVAAEDYFSLARDPAPGTLALHRCDRPGGGVLLTTDAACEGLGVDVGVLGYVGAAPLAGTEPLHHLSRGEPADDLYTLSAIDRDAALADGYTYHGVVAYVWDELGYAVPELPAPPAPDAPDPSEPPDPVDPCADPLTPVYRGYFAARGQHLFAVNHDEILVPGMTDEGVPWQLKPGAPAEGWSPFYRCLLPNSWHLLTTNAECEGAPNAIREGILGNIARDPLPGTQPLYRYFHADPEGKNDHLFVVGTGCVDIPGYACKGVVGHVCPRP